MSWITWAKPFGIAMNGPIIATRPMLSTRMQPPGLSSTAYARLWTTADALCSTPPDYIRSAIIHPSPHRSYRSFTLSLACDLFFTFFSLQLLNKRPRDSTEIRSPSKKQKCDADVVQTTHHHNHHHHHHHHHTSTEPAQTVNNHPFGFNSSLQCIWLWIHSFAVQLIRIVSRSNVLARCLFSQQ